MECLAKPHDPENTKSWPQKSALRELLEKLAAQEGAKSRREIEAWLRRQSQAAWDKFTADISPTSKDRILREYIITHIAAEITKVIKLEEYYLSLQASGQKTWDSSSDELRQLASTNTLIRMVENPELFTHPNGEKREIQDWMRGVVIRLSMLGSKAGQHMINPKIRRLPDPPVVKSAALWVLGPHLKLGEHHMRIEETLHQYETLHDYRNKVKLRLKLLPFDEIAKEVDVPPPPSLAEELAHPDNPELQRNYQWLLSWGFIPNTEREIRAIADQWLNSRGGEQALFQHYQQEIYERWIQNLCRREFLRTTLEKTNIRERLLIKGTVLTPTIKYLEERLPQHNLYFNTIVATECVWKREMDRQRITSS
jgi:hypothetical protein